MKVPNCDCGVVTSANIQFEIPNNINPRPVEIRTSTMPRPARNAVIGVNAITEPARKSSTVPDNVAVKPNEF